MQKTQQKRPVLQSAATSAMDADAAELEGSLL
jgi:hypothetical protein